MNYMVFLIMSLAAFTSAQLLIFLIYNKKRIYLRGILGLFLSVFIYSLFYSFEIISPNLNYMKLFAGIQYIGILSIPVFWVIMALEYTNKSRYINKSLYMSMFLLPALLVFFNFTNDYHHLFYRNYTASTINQLSIANIEPGIGYIISCIYVNVCILIGNILYVRFYIKGSDVYKKRSFIIMITSFIPWLGYWVYMSGILPVKMDIVPIFMTIICLFYTYALFKSNIFETAAIARTVILDHIAEAILVLDMDNKLIDMNKMAEEVFNKKSRMLIGENIEKEFEGYDQIIKHICDSKEGVFDCEIEIQNKLHYFKGEVNLINSNENKGKIIVLRDNTEQVLMIKKLQYYGTTDILTGVYNRNYFYKLAKDRMQFWLDNKDISLIMMDIDKFKNINDNYGHIAGDIVLKKVMEACRELLGEKYCIGRYGGEEFVILLDGINSKKALQIGEKIREQIEKIEILYEGNHIKVTSSFGIFSTAGEKDLEYMIKMADEALYEAKNSGRNKVVIKTTNNKY